MRIAIAAALLALPGAAGSAPFGEAPAAGEGRACPTTAVHRTDTPRRVEPRKLIELPPGRLELPVLRGFGDCIEPVIVREGIGDPAFHEERPRMRVRELHPPRRL